MDITIRPSATAPISYRGDGAHRLGEKVRDNSSELAYGGGAVAVACQSSKIANGLSRAVNGSKIIQAEQKTKIIKVLEKFVPKFAKNPLVQKVAGGLAGLSAATSLIGSTAKIADTYGFLTNQNPAV